MGKDFKSIKIQVKTTSSNNKYAKLVLRKCCLNPKYTSYYSEDEIDIFALYIEDKDIVLYITSKEALQNKTEIRFRFNKSKNNQKCRLVNNYLILGN